MKINQNNIWETLSEEQWRKIIENSTSKAEVARKVGRCNGGSFNQRLDKYIKEHNISIKHFTNKESWPNNNYQLENILIENSPITRKTLRDYLAKYNVLEYKCAICGNVGEWNGVSLTLQIDHINGINNDNRKENLRWLCHKLLLLMGKIKQKKKL